MIRRIASHLMNRIRAIPGEVSQHLWQRAGPQGAAELAQALSSQSNAYVAYGQGQMPTPVADGLHGRTQGASVHGPQPPRQQTYDPAQHAREGVQRGHGHSR
jgi:hypothetical protein